MSTLQVPPMRGTRSSVISVSPSPREARIPMSHRMESWDFVHKQDSSPLFNGHIPAEIRTLIFEFALAESVVPAPDRPIQHAFFSRDDHGKLDDEPVMETGPADETDDQRGDEDGGQTPDVEDGPAPAVQMPPTSFLFPSNRASPGWDWVRPGYTGQRQIQIALLKTCRRVYLETYKLPWQGNKIFYNARGPSWCPDNPKEYISGLAPEAARHIRNLQFFLQMWFLERPLLDMVTGINRVLRRRTGLPLVVNAQAPQPLVPPVPNNPAVQPHPLNPHTPGNPTLPPFVYRHPRAIPSVSDPTEFGPMRAWRLTEHITSLRIYLRRTDWWQWESNAPLVISPFNSPGPQVPGTRPSLREMQDSMRASFEADQKLDPRLRSLSPSIIKQWRCWGLLFLRMANLQTLSIDFETSEDKKAEMETIVNWAHQHWRFPVLRRLSGDASDPFTIEQLTRDLGRRPVDLAPWAQDLDVLTAADQPVQKSSWRGLPQHFADKCPGCSTNWYADNDTPDCAECNKKYKLKGLGKGPQLLVWSIKWTRKAPPKDAEAGANGGGDGREPDSQSRPSTVPHQQQTSAQSNNVGMESHVLSMLPEDAQHRSRRRRELDELINRKVVF
ncbi:hypothetical protein diail_11407 [Diaporthe ilicicola]|nr:hypothetical protein diail_11407 [Diaporthe ilicicola]